MNQFTDVDLVEQWANRYTAGITFTASLGESVFEFSFIRQEGSDVWRVDRADLTREQIRDILSRWADSCPDYQPLEEEMK